MMRSLWTGATGMLGQQKNIDVIANNLANINTVGFKKSTARFQDLLYQELNRAGTIATPNNDLRPAGTQVGLGVKLSAIGKSFAQGEIVLTDSQYDLMIQGKGFFRIQYDGAQNNIAYTRDGSFKINSTGNLVTNDGYLLDPPITIPTGTVNISVSPYGVVEAIDGNGVAQNVGQLQLSTFVNENGLEAIGKNLFNWTAGAGAETQGVPGTVAQGVGTILQGSLEVSNVKAVEEMVQLIEGQRAYEFNSKSIQTSDEMLQLINSLKR